MASYATENPAPEQTVWTEREMEHMEWEHCTVHAFAFLPKSFEFALDIDYLLKWLAPVEPDKYFQVWIAPATLTFQNVYDLKLDIDSFDASLELISITRSEEKKPKNADYISKDKEWLWTIDCEQGEITFYSVGFHLQLKAAPVLQHSLELDLNLRGGITFPPLNVPGIFLNLPAEEIVSAMREGRERG